jgi:chitinase
MIKLSKLALAISLTATITACDSGSGGEKKNKQNQEPSNTETVVPTPSIEDQNSPVVVVPTPSDEASSSPVVIPNPSDEASSSPVVVPNPSNDTSTLPDIEVIIPSEETPTLPAEEVTTPSEETSTLPVEEVTTPSDETPTLPAEEVTNPSEETSNTDDDNKEGDETTEKTNDSDSSDSTDKTENLYSNLTTVTAIPCLPEGLFSTPNFTPNYCDIYDENGREKMGDDHARRVIGYFTSWRTGENGQTRYLASDIPWDKITHINYAFAHIDSTNRVSIGDASNPDNAATGKTWPNVSGAEMSSDFNYKGHFNLLNKFKQEHPDVKTLISIGGWAETGAHFNEEGERVADGGFYSMSTNNDGSINYQGIETFAASAVEFITKYGFDGVDIDYEYPSSMTDAGHPDDFNTSNPKREFLFPAYIELMKTLREKLDQAGMNDNTHYMLTIASPSSAYLLRGMEAFQVTKYLDYINIMSYDLHGSWNEYVGHNAPLFDTGIDNELDFWGVYSTSEYDSIGYLNTDWAYHYFRGAVPAGRINIGIPYYSRGWKGVNGGINGLNGKAALPNQSDCPVGTGGSAKCGNGATGINNLWHDKDSNGLEMGAGSNPLWHTKNLSAGIQPSYLSDYGLDANQMTGNYESHYDSVSVAPWLWNEQQQVFLSIEDEQSMAAKLDYVVDNGIGGVMFWELAGDFSYDDINNEYTVGSTMTNLAYEKFSYANHYGNTLSEQTLADKAINVSIEVGGFKVGDQNYPITPTVTITNNSGMTLAGGTEIQFDISTSTSDQIKDQSGMGLKVISSGSNIGGGNVGGLENDFHRVSLTLPNWQNLSDGAALDFTMVYYLPTTGPANVTVHMNDEVYAITNERPHLPVVTILDSQNATSDSDSENNTTNETCQSDQTENAFDYPNWPRVDHANGADQMIYSGQLFEAKWWTNSTPGSDDSWITVCNI